MRSAERRLTVAAVAVLAVLAFVPALLSSRGRMPADTKLYLYLDPGRLISDAPWTFDTRQFAGWVPHQTIEYLWPQGPWYWLAEQIGLPDWVAQRLWIGALFLAAGTGVLWLARRLGLGLAAALAAALVYQLTPYLLPYVSRTSAMLLPWAGLGWLIGLVAAAATRSRWRHAALAALLVVTTGSINPTALIMIAPAPVLWLAMAAGRGLITWGRAVTTALKVGVLTLSVCVWWMAMVVVQGRNGADVLAYSESLESVSFTSTATEVWRNMGYWLTYVRDAYAPTTSAGRDYMVSGRLIATGFAILLIGVVGLVVTRWAHRAFALSLVVTGVILGVGVHLITDASPLMDALLGDGTSGAALALRSSTRAVPMLVLGLALGAAALVDAVGAWSLPPIAGRRVSWAAMAAVVIGILAIANLPSLTGRRLVDPAIDRDQDVPASWSSAVAALDADGDGGRVMQLPGQEFGAFRWGYTVDPPLPGLTDRPLITRDLLPLGSAPAMDLVYALDDRFQSGTIEPASIAPIARLFGAGTIWLSGDAAFDRFRTPRPELVEDLFRDVPGVGAPESYGEPTVNRPAVPMVDEQSESDPRVGAPIAPVQLVDVDDRVPIIRAKDRSVVLVGSGDGVVDAAAGGLLDGAELIRYSGSLSGGDLAAAVGAADAVIVTDSNRDRAHQWRGSQDVVGFTEDDDRSSPDLLRTDPADERLPVFGTDGAPATVAVQVGPVRARATSYGEPFAYRPEQRPVMAVDGDPTTAWVVGDRADPRGERIVLDVAEPIDHLTLHQPAGAATQRHLGTVSISVAGGAPQVVVLDERSLGTAGQRVDLPPTSGPSEVSIAIDDVIVPQGTPVGPALAGVGFSEIDTGLAPTLEVVRPPADATDALAAAGDETPIALVFSRLRTRPTDRWRSDPEPTMVRQFELPRAAELEPTISVRLDQRASDTVLADLLGIDGARSSAHLVGATAAAGWAATDGDLSTSWQTPFGGAVGATLTLTTSAPTSTVELIQPGGEHSPITAVQLRAGDVVVDAAVPPPDDGGRSTVSLPRALPPGPVELTITAIDPQITIDRRYAEPVVLPAAIAELSIGTPTAVPERLTTGCRDDLVTIDGTAFPVRVDASVADLLAGTAVAAEPCGGPLDLAAGTHRAAHDQGLGHRARGRPGRAAATGSAGHRGRRGRRADGDRAVVGSDQPPRHGRRLPRRVLVGARRRVQRRVVGNDRRRRPRTAAARRRRLQRLVDRADRWPRRRDDALDRPDARHRGPRHQRTRGHRLPAARRSRPTTAAADDVAPAPLRRRRGSGAMADPLDRDRDLDRRGRPAGRLGLGARGRGGRRRPRPRPRTAAPRWARDRRHPGRDGRRRRRCRDDGAAVAGRRVASRASNGSTSSASSPPSASSRPR